MQKEGKEKENGQGWESKFPSARGLGISSCQKEIWEDGVMQGWMEAEAM